LWITCGVYVCCGILRLARFNVENSPEESSHFSFSGLPSPAAAGTIAALVLLHSDVGPDLGKNISGNLQAAVTYCLPFVMLMVGFLMVSRIPFDHLTNKYIRGRKTFNYIVWAVPIFICLWTKLQLTLVAGLTIYVFGGIFVYAKNSWKTRKNNRKPKNEAENS
jgi:CDP-diacylglycerol--serine O-phosphatidyltransferase